MADTFMKYHRSLKSVAGLVIVLSMISLHGSDEVVVSGDTINSVRCLFEQKGVGLYVQ